MKVSIDNVLRSAGWLFSASLIAGCASSADTSSMSMGAVDQQPVKIAYVVDSTIDKEDHINSYNAGLAPQVVADPTEMRDLGQLLSESKNWIAIYSVGTEPSILSTFLDCSRADGGLVCDQYQIENYETKDMATQRPQDMDPESRGATAFVDSSRVAEKIVSVVSSKLDPEQIKPDLEALSETISKSHRSVIIAPDAGASRAIVYDCWWHLGRPWCWAY